MDNLKLVENFFKMNLAVKNIIVKLTPKEEDGYDLNACMSYVEKLEVNLTTILELLSKMAQILGLGEDALNHISNQISGFLIKIINCNYDFNKITSLYNEFVQKMDESLVNKLNENVVGYYLGSNPYGIFMMAKTVTEMLHILHHAMINNENIYEKVPLLAKKDDIREIFLRGKDTAIAREILSGFDSKIAAGVVEILSISEDKVLIMARDLGHALTIELEIDESEVLVRYFIPKICNYIMVNNLPGVRPVNKDSKFTTGEFLVYKNNLSEKLNKFMLMVPNDDHMFIYGGPCYKDREEPSVKL